MAERTHESRRGAWGERVAARRLRLRGWWVLARRYRAGGGEIDLIARRDRVLAVCEVKTRQRLGAIPVIAGPQVERIRRAATAFCAAEPELGALEVRLDLIVVTPRRLGPARVRHLARGLE